VVVLHQETEVTGSECVTGLRMGEHEFYGVNTISVSINMLSRLSMDLFRYISPRRNNTQYDTLASLGQCGAGISVGPLRVADSSR
jgi:hypothetical protein